MAKKAMSARTTREIGNNKPVYPKGVLARISKYPTPVNYGVSRVVVVKACSNCGYQLQEKIVECQTDRFRCPQCGQSVVNSIENRCKVCFMLCAGSETANVHKRGGCPNAGLPYPFKGHLAYRDENPKEKVTP